MAAIWCPQSVENRKRLRALGKEFYCNPAHIGYVVLAVLDDLGEKVRKNKGGSK